MERGTALRVGVVAAGVAGAGIAIAAARARHQDDDLVTILDGGEHTKVETSDGAVLAVHVAPGPSGPLSGDGDGPTVVLTHCWTGNMDTWAPVAAALVDRGRRVVRYDQRGHGQSTTGADGSSVSRLGNDLREVLEALDVHGAVLAGHSMGGMAAQAFAIDDPDVLAARVASLVLVATSSGGLSRAPLNRLAPFFVGSPTVERLLTGRVGPALVRRSLGKGARRSAVRATRDAFVATPAAVRVDQIRALNAMDLTAGCAGIAVPTTVVVGSRDTLTPPRHARAIAAAVPGARLVEVKGAGHMLPLETTDLLTDLIVEAHR